MLSERLLRSLSRRPRETLRRIDAERGLRSLEVFCRDTWHVLEPTTPLEWNWHLSAVCLHVQAILEDWMARRRDPSHRQRFQNLLINIPPGTAKSRFVSVLAPAWMWLRWPSWKVICISANPRVALRDAVYCRELVESDWYRKRFRPDWGLAKHQNAKGLYRNTAGGWRLSLGFKGKIIGDRADAQILDDPNDADEVHSDALREAVNDRYDDSIANRLNDLRTSVRIGIMQRLHERDWSGHVLKAGGWEHLVLPQEYDPALARVSAIGWSDPRREVGELLFPRRFPPEVLAKERARLGSFGYAGQHQQRPAPAGGAIFKADWFRYWSAEHSGDEAYYRLKLKATAKLVKAKDCRRFGTVDLAVSTRTNADYTVIMAWAVTPESDLILLDVYRERVEGPDIVPAIKRMSDKHGLGYVGIERVGAQLAFVQAARRDGLAIRGLEADGGKLERAIPATIRMEAEQIFFPEGAPFLSAVEHELLMFDKGAHDDCVDALAYAANEVLKHGGAPEPEDLREAREHAEQAKAEELWDDPQHSHWWQDEA